MSAMSIMYLEKARWQQKTKYPESQYKEFALDLEPFHNGCRAKNAFKETIRGLKKLVTLKEIQGLIYLLGAAHPLLAICRI